MSGPVIGARRAIGGRVVGGSGSRGAEGGAPLTVAAVAARLGVAASTLRTWDRRYGLGPSSHEAGAHRRYTPSDVARLERMRHLTLQGVAPADAAAAVTGAVDDENAPLTDRRRPDHERHQGRMLVDPLTLAAAALEPDEPRVHRMLDQELSDHGIVHMWTGLALPAQALLERRESTDRPGVDPALLIDAAVLAVAREVTVAAEQARARPVQLVRVGVPAPPAPQRTVTIVAGPDHRMDGHVLGAALAERGVRARVQRAGTGDDVEQEVRSPVLRGGVRVVAVLGALSQAETYARRATADGADVFLVGPDAVDLWLPHVRRVRSLLVAAEEIAGLLEESEMAHGHVEADREG